MLPGLFAYLEPGKTAEFPAYHQFTTLYSIHTQLRGIVHLVETQAS